MEVIPYTTLQERMHKVIRDRLQVTDTQLAKNPCRFVENLGADSMDRVELILYIEDEFNLEFTSSEVDAIHTTDQLYITLLAKIHAKPYGDKK